MPFFKNLWTRLKPFIKNKYVLTVLLFVLFLLFFDQYNILKRVKTQQNIKHLEKEISIYKKKISNDKEKLQELQSNNENLEKFAREQYLMKKENEDIFVIEE